MKAERKAMNNELIPFSAGDISGTLSEADENTLLLKLWKLLKRQTEMYTMGDSSSVRIEVAQELLESINFCLDLYLKKSGNTRELLVSGDLNEIFALGIKEVEAEIERSKKLYHAAIVSAPDIDNLSFKDTLKNIGKFYRHYDYRYFARQAACDIDYQLCNAVEDSFEGIEYINEYLSRLIIENDFIRRFDKERVIALLSAYCSDYKGLLINLYSPVAENAIGKALIGESAAELGISEKERTGIIELFEKLSMTPAKSALIEAAEKVCAEMDIKDKASQSYLRKTAEGMYPRIEAALPSGNLSGIFLDF